MSIEQNKEKFSQLVKRAQADPTLMDRLLDDPNQVLMESGIEIPEGLQVRIVRDQNSISCLVEPKPDPSELEEKELAATVGGTPKSTAPKTTKSTTNPQEYLTYTMTEVFVSSY